MENPHTLKEAKKPLGVTTRTIQRWGKEGLRVSKILYQVRAYNIKTRLRCP
ncbi:MAG: MerR family transcriptional regulator [Thermoprotei archaeon]|nr:MerR family transcriptional regulator [Thermoprotei archaeon]